MPLPTATTGIYLLLYIWSFIHNRNHEEIIQEVTNRTKSH